MSIDGTYQVTVKTPLGKQKGKLNIASSGNTFSGSLETGSGATHFSGGLIDGDTLRWQAETKTPMGAFEVSYTATIDGSRITGEASTPMGKAPLEGKKV
jgi:hypothetical protein